MYALIVLTLGIDDINSFVLANKYTLVTYLTTHLTIERSIVEYKFIETVLLLSHLAVTEDVALIFCVVVTNKLLFAFTQYFPVTILYSGSIARTCFLLFHLLVELLLVNSISVLCADKFGEVEWETVGIEEAESLLTIELSLTMCLQLVHCTVKEHDTLFQCAKE